MTHLADNMRRRGKITFENHRNLVYCYADIFEVIYRGYLWQIIYIDGLVCRIEKKGEICTKK